MIVVRRVWLPVLLCVCPPAFANDKPDTGPIPAWVKPVTPPPANDKNKDQPVVLLLLDQQVDLTRGRKTAYAETVLKIQTPQGLAAGNISIPWRPDTDMLVVHKLIIRRGDQVIDVLASGQTFTVIRRETNLDTATLDGVLTANIQPEGLQVGDVIDMAVSISTSDPVLKNHVELLTGFWDIVPTTRVHLRVQWPSEVPLRLRQTASLPPLKPVKSGGMTSIEFSGDELKRVVTPKGAPARYQFGRIVELSDFASWGDLAALFAPLYDKAGTLPANGPLLQEVEKIRAQSTDPKVRTEAALALVQDRVRYVALAMGSGGLVPADAATTWSRRFGDCKAKTALLLAILHSLGIQSEAVVVDAGNGDGTDARLPMVGLFNHVLVRATVAGKTYWLDGTRTGDANIDRLTIPDVGWGLPITPKGAVLTRMLPTPLEKPNSTVSIQIDARGGITLPAPFQVKMRLSGDSGLASKQMFDAVAPDVRERGVRDYWREQYDFVEIKSTNVTFDPKTGEQILSMDGMAKMDWSSGSYQTDGTSLGYKADFTREPGSDNDAPYAVSYPTFAKVTETVLLPPGFQGSKNSVVVDVNETIAGVEYKRSATMADNVFTVESSERAIAPEFPAKDAPGAQTKLRAMAERSISIRRPAGYRPTDGELAASLATTPTTASDLIRRGTILLDRGRMGDAIKDFSAALAIEPKDATALANRGLARVWKGDLEAAQKDLADAAAIDPRNAVIFRAQGLLADNDRKPRDAIAAYTTSLDIDPNSSFALAHRATAYRSVGEDEAALKDSAAAIKIKPDNEDMYLLRANIYRGMGNKDLAIAEAAAVTAANPNDAYAHTVAAAIYSRYAMKAEALKAYENALAIKPEAYIYITRSRYRPRADITGRRADVDAALKLEPGSIDGLSAKAALQTEAKDYAGAIATYTSALARNPDNVSFLASRAIAYSRNGDAALAESDFKTARGKAKGGEDFNSLCWTSATANFALDAALSDCDVALKKLPDNAAIMDSRGFVLMRLGRSQEAITTYTAALAKNPDLAASQFGRGVALAQLGEKAKAAADFAAAEKIDPDVKAQFETYGITAPQ